MTRFLAAVALCCAFAVVTYAQDSGPGPVDPNTVQDYDVSLFQRGGTTAGTFSFYAADDASTERTTGDFAGTVDADAFSGAYHAYDLGDYSFWYAHGDGDTNALTAFGWATPDVVVGRATLTANSGDWWFWRLFSRKSYWFYGTAVKSEAPPETMGT